MSIRAVNLGINHCFVLQGDGSLVIESPTRDDSGLYTCFVANGVGSALARSNLVVRGNKVELDDDARAAIKSQKVFYL